MVIHQPDQAEYRSVLPEEIDWKPFPTFPPSVRLAIVVGDPSEPAAIRHPGQGPLQRQADAAPAPGRPRLLGSFPASSTSASEACSMKSGWRRIHREPSLCSRVVPRISTGRNLEPTSPKYRPSDRSASNTSIRSTIPGTSEQGLGLSMTPSTHVRENGIGWSRSIKGPAPNRYSAVLVDDALLQPRWEPPAAFLSRPDLRRFRRPCGKAWPSAGRLTSQTRDELGHDLRRWS